MSKGNVCTFLSVRAVPCLRQLNESSVRFLSDSILHFLQSRVEK